MANGQQQVIEEIVPVEGIDLDPEEAPYAKEEEPQPRRRRRKGFRFGLIFGIAAGAVGALVLQRGGAREESAGSHATSQPDGTLASLRARLRSAAGEARQAAQEAEQGKRSRFKELIERE